MYFVFSILFEVGRSRLFRRNDQDLVLLARQRVSEQAAQERAQGRGRFLGICLGLVTRPPRETPELLSRIGADTVLLVHMLPRPNKHIPDKRLLAVILEERAMSLAMALTSGIKWLSFQEFS